jgi:hypothetical protein
VNRIINRKPLFCQLVYLRSFATLYFAKQDWYTVAPTTGGVAQFFRKGGSLFTGMMALLDRNIHNAEEGCNEHPPAQPSEFPYLHL